ncbi:hypothetical protein LINGRAHAP2_LOCUS26051 [Linum grandiflorum]
MKQLDKKRTPNTTESKRGARAETKGRSRQVGGGRALNVKPDSSAVVSDSNARSEEVYENVVIHYVDDVNRSEGAPNSAKAKGNMGLGDSDVEREQKVVGKEEESDSVSSHGGDSVIGDDEKVEQVARVARTVGGAKKVSKEITGSRGGSRVRDREAGKPVAKAMSNNSTKKPGISSNGASKVSTKIASDQKNVKEGRDLPAETCDGDEDMVIDDGKEVEVFEEASNATQSVASDSETIDVEENGEQEDATVVNQRIEEMEMKIEKLEAELREVAALEISLYSVVPEHGSSAHKVHTPARRLSRLYIHAGKHWSLDRRATIAKNTVSGLVLISKSCGTDVPRLSFWLSNTIVLRAIISQAFGSSCNSSISRLMQSNSSMSRKWKAGNGYSQFAEDWQETGTFTAALEKVESWIFSRIVESVWWQALTPHMQPPKKNLSTTKSGSRLLGPALGDQQQGNFSINLWKNAFQDAFRRICPVRAGGHECGCLPVVAKMVMEQCVERLDVAMFNAILRESANEIPTDPVSDPIVDSRVLPIPAGDLSFGSGAQLKNSVGNWSRWLSDSVGMDDEEPPEQDEVDDDRQYTKPKCFNLLNDLSDLLMLPKDLLADRSVRKEVCPSIGLPLVKRILCYFTPDEFCPDAVPGAVLEALNADTIVERKLSGESTRSFPYSAASVFYTPPPCDSVSEKVAEAATTSQLSRNASIVQRKGYTSDEELEELDSPLISLEKPHLSAANGNWNGNGKQNEPKVTSNARYELLREVWSG